MSDQEPRNRAERRYLWRGMRFKGHIRPEDEIVLARVSEVVKWDIGELRFMYLNCKWNLEEMMKTLRDILEKVDSGEVEIVETKHDD